MRNLYLVRHGKVEFPDGIRRCIGWTDFPLSDDGRRQARELHIRFEDVLKNGAVIFASPLKRAWETAQLLAGDLASVHQEEGLKELNMGEWENVPMNQLKKNLESEPEKGESRICGAERIRQTMVRILAETEGDIICVAHAGINSCLLAELTDTPLEISRALPQPYGGFCRIEIKGRDMMEVKELGIMPKKAPAREECQAIWNHYHTPENVCRHCQEVCREAEDIARKLLKAGHRIDLKVIQSAALLHDVARTKKNHAQEGACVLVREGYPRVAEIIRKHHDLECPNQHLLSDQEFDRWLEEAVVYLADKRIQKENKVPLEQRFEQSRARCEKMPDREAALAAHERRYEYAKKIETMIEMQIDGGER